MNYIINNDNIKIREEKNGTYSFMNMKNMKIVFLNKVASYIFLHPEIKNLDDISISVYNHFDSPSIETIKKDCKELLLKMNALELISIEKSAEIFQKGYNIIGEEDYSKLCMFIKNCFRNNKNIIMLANSNSNYYTAYSMRIRQFNNKEFNYVYINRKRQIESLITLGVETTSAYVVANIFGDESNFKIMKELLEYAFAITPNLNKIRISVKSNQLGLSTMRFAEKLGFEKEAVLKDEYGKNEDLLCYALFRNK